jgi:SH3 domain-containing YSC84-like protein 1
MRSISIAATIVCLSAGLVSAGEKETERLAEAAKTIDEIMATPDKGVPASVFDKAECVVVIPGMKKGGFIVGG